MAAPVVDLLTEITTLLNADTTSVLGWIGEDTNGDHTYSNDRALYGFVKVFEYVHIPEDYLDIVAETPNVDGTDRVFPDIPVETFGSSTGIRNYLGGTAEGTAYINRTTYVYLNDTLVREKIAFMNYVSLREGGVTQLDAFLVAALRARWITLGAWKIAMDDTTRPYDEHIVVASNPGGTVMERISAATTRAEMFACSVAYAREFFTQCKSETSGMAWVIKHAETIWAAEEFICRVRGHHYKQEYEPALIKFVTSCMEGEDAMPAGANLEYLFRIAIHPFGIRALPIMTAHFMIHGKVGNAGLLRINGAPNGMAVVTTTLACLKAMNGEAWYGRFEAIYGARIKLLEEFEKDVLSNKFAYHMSHRLYGMASKNSCTVGGTTYTVDKMKEHAAGLATFAQGFIEALKEAKEAGTITAFSFSNARVMEKAAGTNPLMTLRVRGLIIYTVEAIQDAKDIDSATRIALPMTSIVQNPSITGPTSTAITTT